MSDRRHFLRIIQTGPRWVPYCDCGWVGETVDERTDARALARQHGEPRRKERAR